MKTKKVTESSHTWVHLSTGKLIEFDFPDTGCTSDPFDSDDIKVDIHIKTPSGKMIVMPCFYDDTEDPKLPWKARYTPLELGSHQYLCIARSKGKTLTTIATSGFTVKSKGNHMPFLHVADDHALCYPEGQRFKGIGINFAWEEEPGRKRGKETYSYETFLPRFKKHGGNLMRTWSCPWNLPLIWNTKNQKTPDSSHPNRYNLKAIAKIDNLVKQAQEEGIHIMWCLDYHGAIKEKKDYWGGNAFWRDHPYNQKNGGSCKSRDQVFTDPKAIHDYQDRLRYIIARWGYSPSVSIFELWNEIDNAMEEDATTISVQEIISWHEIMAKYLKQLDPYQRPVTTSLSHSIFKGLFKIPSIDFAQLHLYCQGDKLKELLAEARDQHQKPVVIGEVGYDWRAPEDGQVELFKNDLQIALWRCLFSATPILPMAWWWELYNENNGLPIIHEVSDFANLIQEKCNWDVQCITLNEQPEIEIMALVAKHQSYVWLNPSTKFEKPIQLPKQLTENLQNPSIFYYDIQSRDMSLISTKTIESREGHFELHLENLHHQTVLIFEG